MDLTQTTYTESSTEATPQATGLAAGVQALGLDSKLLAAQIINFIILLLLLRKFLYGPIVGLLEKRRQQIESSVTKAEEIEKRHTEFMIEHEQRINQSKAEAADIVASAKKAGEQLRQEILLATQTENDKLLAKAKTEIEQQKSAMLTELKHEVGQLVVEATTKLIGQEFVGQLEQRTIDEAVAAVKQGED